MTFFCVAGTPCPHALGESFSTRPACLLLTLESLVAVSGFRIELQRARSGDSLLRVRGSLLTIVTRTNCVVTRSTRDGDRRTPCVTGSTRRRTHIMGFSAGATRRLSGLTRGVTDSRRAPPRCETIGCHPRTVGDRLRTRRRRCMRRRRGPGGGGGDDVRTAGMSQTCIALTVSPQQKGRDRGCAPHLSGNIAGIAPREPMATIGLDPSALL